MGRFLPWRTRDTYFTELTVCLNRKVDEPSAADDDEHEPNGKRRLGVFGDPVRQVVVEVINHEGEACVETVAFPHLPRDCKIYIGIEARGSHERSVGVLPAREYLAFNRSLLFEVYYATKDMGEFEPHEAIQRNKTGSLESYSPNNASNELIRILPVPPKLLSDGIYRSKEFGAVTTVELGRSFM